MFKAFNSIKLLVNFLRSISNTAIRDGFVTNQDLIIKLDQFVPNSSGSLRNLAALTLLSAQQTFPLLCELLVKLSFSAAKTKAIETICTESSSLTAANKLAMLFNKYGSDKSTTHNYQFLYGKILAEKCSQELDVLEIGIGTNNRRIVSYMQPSEKPGASLRALRDFLPKSRIYGADIDKNVLFQEERIETFFVDQTKPETFKEIPADISSKKFDLIIDDGLHSPNANISTLIFALERLKIGGWLVIEDIGKASLPIWNVVLGLLPVRFNVFLCEAENGFLFVAHNQ